LKYGENLNLYSVPIRTNDGSVHYFTFRHEKGKFLELYADLESPQKDNSERRRAAKLSARFSKVTNINMETLFDAAGNLQSSGLYIGNRVKNGTSESLRVEIEDVNFADPVNHNMLSTLQEIANNSNGNLHVNENPDPTDNKIAVQGYRMIQTDPITGQQEITFLKKNDGDPDPQNSAGITYEPTYSIGGERGYTINWDNVAKLKNETQKEIVAKEPVKEEEKEKKEDPKVPRLPKRKKKTVNEYMTSLSLLGVGMLGMVIGILNPFFLILTAVSWGALLLKDTGILAVLVEVFKPRERDALDVHRDIVENRSKIVEKDRQILDIQAKMEEIINRAGKNINPETCKARYQNLVLPANIVDASGRPVDLKNVTVSIDPATGELVFKDLSGNDLSVVIKNKQGFTNKQLEQILNIQRLLRQTEEEMSRERNALKRKALAGEAKDYEDRLAEHYNKDDKDLKELKRREKELKKQLKRKRQKESNLTTEANTFFNGGTDYDLDPVNAYYNLEGKNDAAQSANADGKYTPNPDNVQTKGDRANAK
ncbi:MAG: hypothetical protein K2K31_02255, partial [Clostridia bacterium]|nr:hypothetical protein [Clostridia bacterium]